MKNYVSTYTSDVLEELEFVLENKNRENEKMKIEEEFKNIANSLVREAVIHFSKRSVHRKGDFDERYFYQKSDVDSFFQHNKNPNVKLETVYDDFGNIDYYMLHR